MADHFLKDYVEGEPGFKDEPWYNEHGDCVVYKSANEATCAERIDSILTLYRSAIDDRVIGFQIKGVAALMREFGLAGMSIHAETDRDEVVSVSMLLLAAVRASKEVGTRDRLEAYDSVLPLAARQRVAIGQPCLH